MVTERVFCRSAITRPRLVCFLAENPPALLSGAVLHVQLYDRGGRRQLRRRQVFSTICMIPSRSVLPVDCSISVLSLPP